MAFNFNNQTALTLFMILLFTRYTRTVVGIYTYLAYKPKTIAARPIYRTEDATVVVPTTFKAPGQLIQCLRRMKSCSPALIIIVTSLANVELVKTCCALNSFRDIQVLGVAKLNKRRQMLKALEVVKTDITVFADDDVFWPDRYLEYLLACFECQKVGACGTRQRVRRNGRPNCWDFLGASYLVRRSWNNVTTNAIDGSISTLSGRSAAYRTEILKTDEFFHYFREDAWLGRKLNSDDDKFLTRYLYAHGWDIALQFDPNAIIETTLEDNPQYLQQCLRWARSHWRGNFTVMSEETYWRSVRHCWGAYVIYLGQFQTPALLVDPTLLLLLCKAAQGSECKKMALILLALWIVFTKLLKLIPHFYQYPSDLRFIPLSIV